MQFSTQMDPRIGQWLNIAAFVLSTLAMASWWQDLLSAKQVAAAVGVMNLSVSTINYVLHGMPAPVVQVAKAVLAFFAILVLSAMFWLFAPLAAIAADVTVKAPVVPAAPFIPAPKCSLTDCSGFYGGLNMIEAGGNFDLVGSGLNGLAQNNFAMGGQLGAELYNGQWRLGFEVTGDYGISQVGNLPGGGNRKLWSAGELVCVGYSLSPLFGIAASGSSTTPAPTLPAALANALMAPCVLVGAWERPWGIGFASGARASALFAKGWTLDVDYIHVDYNNANVNPIVSEQTENIVRAGINYHF